jgi:hypothetical protein
MVPLLVLAFVSLFPQGDTGQLSGRVVDSNGAEVPAANVKLISQSTSQLREITTRDSGDFAFTLLPSGLYKLEVIATGFRNVQIDAVQINITQTTSVTSISSRQQSRASSTSTPTLPWSN